MLVILMVIMCIGGNQDDKWESMPLRNFPIRSPFYCTLSCALVSTALMVEINQIVLGLLYKCFRWMVMLAENNYGI